MLRRSGIGGGRSFSRRRRASCARRRGRRADGAERAPRRRRQRRPADGDGAEPVGQAARASGGANRAGKRGKFAGRVVAEEELRTEPLPRPSGNLQIVSAAQIRATGEGKHLQPGRLVQIEAMDELNGVLRCRRTDDEKPIDIQLLTWMSLIYDHFGGKPLQDRLGLSQPAQADEQPLQGARDRHPDRGRERQAGPRVCADAGSRWDGHRSLSAQRVRAHRRPLAAQLPLDRQLAGEFERGREAPAARLEAQEARELSAVARVRLPPRAAVIGGFLGSADARGQVPPEICRGRLVDASVLTSARPPISFAVVTAVRRRRRLRGRLARRRTAERAAAAARRDRSAARARAATRAARAAAAGDVGTAGTGGTAGDGGTAGTGGSIGPGGSGGSGGTAGPAGRAAQRGQRRSRRNAGGSAGSGGTGGSAGRGGAGGTGGTGGAPCSARELRERQGLRARDDDVRRLRHRRPLRHGVRRGPHLRRRFVRHRRLPRERRVPERADLHRQHVRAVHRRTRAAARASSASTAPA